VSVNLTGQPSIIPGTMVYPGPILGGQAARAWETVANTFDPSVTGLARPVGSIVFTHDGTKAWLKYGTTSTNWASLALYPSYPSFAGVNLVDGNAVVSPGNDKASEYVLPAATLTANRNVTLQTSSAVTGQLVRIVRKDLTANTYAVINGGTNGGTLFTFGASPTGVQAVTAYYNGVDWVFVGFEYLKAA
jgi:hypothetical protein